MKRAVPVLLVLLGGGLCLAEALPPSSDFEPILVGPGPGDDAAAKAPRQAGPRPAAPRKRPEIAVDEAAGTIRLPVQFSGAGGVVEWLLSAGQRHRMTSVLVTAAPVRDVVEAAARLKLPPGAPPVVLEGDRVRPPRGVSVEVSLLVRQPDGKQVRLPASRLLTLSRKGEPVGEGRWVYAGPQTVSEGEAEILVTAISGSLVTTNLRDTSALIHWVPAAAEGEVSVAPTYYAARPPAVPEGSIVELEVRAAGAATEPPEVSEPSPEGKKP